MSAAFAVALSLLVATPTQPPFPSLADIQALCVDKGGAELPEASSPIDLAATTEVTPPQVLKRVQPNFPTARGCRNVPRFDVRAIITTEGTVCGATVVTDLSPECAHFGPPLLRAVNKWKFAPAMKDSQPVAVLFLLSIDYRPAIRR